ncbi:hypothetical protein K456DRAFT_588474 [Colletotrichum gloeosporioides 23]|nr:hypothetical protein K456DRAFT_588474 [Colletotrichum gloeosporioides 23]
MEAQFSFVAYFFLMSPTPPWVSRTGRCCSPSGFNPPDTCIFQWDNRRICFTMDLISVDSRVVHVFNWMLLDMLVRR